MRLVCAIGGLCVIGALSAVGQVVQTNQPAGQATNAVAKAAARKPVGYWELRSNNEAFDAVLNKMKLSEDEKVAIVDALKSWSASLAAAAKQQDERRRKIKDQIAKEKDQALAADLQRQLDEIKPPAELEKYESVKTALKPVLPTDQFEKIDELVKATQTGHAMGFFVSKTSGWPVALRPLTDEQKAAIAKRQAKLAEELAPVAAGDATKAEVLAVKAMWEVRLGVLTAEQQAKLGKTRDANPQAGGCAYVCHQ